MRRKAAGAAYWTLETHLLREDEYVCSACGKAEDKAYTTCPNCGARMSGSKYNPVHIEEAEILDIIFED